VTAASERLYFDADRSKLVTEDDPAARFLAAAVGDDIPEGFDAPKKTVKAENKQAPKAENK
jgi:hypothetical protein